MTTIGVFACIFNDQKQVLCVQRNYPPFGWTTPGGRLEDGEAPEDGVIREVYEETGFHVEVEKLVGIYSAPFKSDIVISYQCRITARDDWRPNSEISAVQYFDLAHLPVGMKENTRVRIIDASVVEEGGISRVYRTIDEHGISNAITS